MKKIALAILAIALTLPAVYAQEKTEPNTNEKIQHDRPGKNRHRSREMYEKLNLTPKQRDAMNKVNADYRSSVAELKKKEATITAQDYKNQMKALNEKRRSDADKILTQEQKDQMKQMRRNKTRKFNSEAKSKQVRPDLDLTNEQSAKMQSLRADTQNKIKDIRGNTALTREQKKEQITTVFQQQHEEIKKNLTPEQMKKMEETRKKKPSKAV